jgi:predicted glycoside hydrolase/deacetylase ChbG (UPF0249 family)
MAALMPAAPLGFAPADLAPARPQRPRTLCIGVDDFGLHAGINKAALRLVELGRVHAVGCMVGGDTWRAWCPTLQRLPGECVDVGLHLDLIEMPVLPSSRRSLAGLITASLAGLLGRSAVRAEIVAQLDAFEHCIGRAPAFVDGHRHVHQLPIVRSELLDELQLRYGPARPWLRSTRRVRQVDDRASPWPDASKAHVIEALGGRGLATLAGDLGYPHNRHLLGVYDFRGGARRYARLLAGWLHCADDADLLMCHPSLPHEGADALIDARRAEFAVLSGIGLGAMLQHENLRLEPMSQILATARPAARDVEAAFSPQATQT